MVPQFRIFLFLSWLCSLESPGRRPTDHSPLDPYSQDIQTVQSLIIARFRRKHALSIPPQRDRLTSVRILR